jgi:uncharacterized membrane protein YedE/YeeE
MALQEQVAWYIAGPVMGLCVIAVRVLFNARLGVTGGFSELVAKLRSGRTDFDWRGWLVIGILIGALAFGLAAGGAAFSGYGWMTRTFTGEAQILIPVLLVISGALIGFGAKVAGGCTSGNGLSGVSSLSPASLAATGTFFATAIVVSVVIEALI